MLVTFDVPVTRLKDSLLLTLDRRDPSVMLMPVPTLEHRSSKREMSASHAQKAHPRRRLGKAPEEVHAVEIEWRDR